MRSSSLSISVVKSQLSWSGIIVSILLMLVMLMMLIQQTSADHYTDQWAVRIKGGEDVAKQLAADHGFVFVSKVGI